MTPVISGLLVGVLFGFALQRGRFCMNSAFRDIILGRDFTLFKALAVAILVSMIGFSIMALPRKSMRCCFMSSATIMKETT